MTSTVKRPAPVPPLSRPSAGGGGNLPSASNTVDGHDVQNSGGSGVDTCSSSLNEPINLTVVLPNEQQLVIDVDDRQSMIDLLIHVCSLVRISPADHTILVFSDADAAARSRRLVQYKASQSLRSLGGVSTVRVVQKKSSVAAMEQSSKNVPFEITHRVTFNLPNNQKHVVRVRPDIPVGELFQMAVDDKRIDPDRCELRHPTRPEVVLDMTSPLSRYGVTEVCVVARPGVGKKKSVPPPPPTQQGGTQSPDCDRSRSSTAAAPIASKLPNDHRSGIPSTPPIEVEESSNPDGQHPLPDMAAAEKKRGFFTGFFRRNKHGKSTVLTSERNDVHTTVVDEPVQFSTIPRASTHTHEVVRNGSISVPLTTSSAVVATEAELQPRKKRAAPRPPSAVVATKAAQSPTGSDSSGFEDSNSTPSSVPTTSSSTATSSPLPNDDQKNFQPASKSRGDTDVENAIAIVSSTVQPVQKPTRNRRSTPVPPDDSPPALKSSGFDASHSLQSTNHSKTAEGNTRLAENANRQSAGGFQESVTVNGYSGNAADDNGNDGVEISLDATNVEYVQPVRPKLKQGETARKPLSPVFGSLTRQTNGSSQPQKNRNDEYEPKAELTVKDIVNTDSSEAPVLFRKKSLPETVDDLQSSESETEKTETDAEDGKEQEITESNTALQKSVGLFTYSYTSGEVSQPQKSPSKFQKEIELVQKQEAGGIAERSKSSSGSSMLKDERVRVVNVHSADLNGKDEGRNGEEEVMDESIVALQKSVGLYTYSYSAGNTAASQPAKSSSSKSHSDGRHESSSASANSQRHSRTYDHRETSAEVRVADRNGKKDALKDRVSISHEVHRSPSESPTVEIGQTARADELDDRFELSAGRLQSSDVRAAGRRDSPIVERLNRPQKNETEFELSAGRSSSIAQVKINSSAGARERSRLTDDIRQENEFELTAGRSSASVSVVETSSAPVVRETAATKDKEFELSGNRQRMVTEVKPSQMVEDVHRDTKKHDDVSEVSSRIQFRSGKVDIGVFDDGSLSVEHGKQNKTVQQTSSNDSSDVLFNRVAGLDVVNDDGMSTGDKDDTAGSASKLMNSDAGSSMWEEIQSEMDLRMAKERDRGAEASSLGLNDSSPAETGNGKEKDSSNVVVKIASRDSTFTSPTELELKTGYSSQAVKPESPYASEVVYHSKQESTESGSKSTSTKSAEEQQPKMQVYNSLRDARRGKTTSWHPETIVIDKPNIYTMFGGATKQDQASKSDVTAVPKVTEDRSTALAAVIQIQPEESKTKPLESVKLDRVKVAESATVASVKIADYEQKTEDVMARPKYSSRHSLYYESGSLDRSTESATARKKESSPVLKSPPSTSSSSPQESVGGKKLQAYQDAKTTMIKIVNGNAVIGGSGSSKPASTSPGAASSRMVEYVRESPEMDRSDKNVEKPAQKTAYTTRVTVGATEDPKIHPDVSKGSKNDAYSRHSAKLDVDDAPAMAKVNSGAAPKLESTSKFSSSNSTETSVKVTHASPKASTDTQPATRDPTEMEKLAARSTVSETTAAKVPVASASSQSDNRSHNSEMQSKPNPESSSVAQEPRIMLRSGNRVSDAMQIFNSGGGSSSTMSNQQSVSAVRYGASRERPKSAILEGRQISETTTKDDRKGTASVAEVAHEDASINRKDTGAATGRSHGTIGDKGGNSTDEQRRPNLSETTGKSDVRNTVNQQSATVKLSTSAVADKEVMKKNGDVKLAPVKLAEVAKQPLSHTTENVGRNSNRSTLNTSSVNKQAENGTKSDPAVGSAVRYSSKSGSPPVNKDDKQMSAAAMASNNRATNVSLKETGSVGSARAVNESKSVGGGKEVKKTGSDEERSAVKPAEVTAKQSVVRRTGSTPGSSSMQLTAAAAAAPESKPEFISVQLRPVQKKPMDDIKSTTEPSAGTLSNCKLLNSTVTAAEPSRENRNTTGNVQKQSDSLSSAEVGKVQTGKQPSENRTAINSNPPAASKMPPNKAQPMETRPNDTSDLPSSRYALRRSMTAPVATNPGLNLSPTEEKMKPESPTSNRTSVFGVTLKSRNGSDNQKSDPAHVRPISSVEMVSRRVPASTSKDEESAAPSCTVSLSAAEIKSSKTETNVTSSKTDHATENKNAPGSSRVVHSHSAASLTSSLSRTGKGANVSVSSSQNDKKPVTVATQPETVNLRRAVTASDVKLASSASKPEDAELKHVVVLQPARARPPAKNLPPPKLTLHEELMNAIRGAGGSVIAVTNGNPPESRQSPRMEDSTIAKGLESTKSGTEAAASKATASVSTLSTQNASSQGGALKLNSAAATRTTRSKRVIEAPKLTPREELMAAIRGAAGSASGKSASVSTESDESPVERCSAKLVDENWTSKSVIRLASSSSSGAAVSPLTPPVSSTASVPVVSGGSAPPPPPLPPTLPATSGPPKKATPSGRNLGPPQLDPREELLAAIRNAAGGKTLRKTSSSDGH